MKKKLILKSFLIVGFVFLVMGCKNNKGNQKEGIDQDAIALLSKVEKNFSDLGAISFKLAVDEEKLDSVGKVEAIHCDNVVDVVKPNKLFVSHLQENKNFNYWYDGEYFTYYSKDENNYVSLEAPETIADLIAEMHEKYDFNFPAGDFFYPSFDEDLTENFNKVELKDKEDVNGESCSKVLLSNDDMDVEILVLEKTFLPKKFKVVYKKQNNIKYEASFVDWNTKPDFNDSTFEYSVPEDAHLISIMSK